MSEKVVGNMGSVENGKDRENKSTDSLCLDYVMKYSLEEIRSSSGDMAMNQLCSEYIQNKEAFIKYVENKRKIMGKSGGGCGNGEE